jgi:hypothetical protein
MHDAASLLKAPTLCGHDDARQKISDLGGQAVMCTPCYRLARAARDHYMDGAIGLGEVRALLTPIVGREEARAYAHQLCLARWQQRLGQWRSHLFGRTST